MEYVIGYFIIGIILGLRWQDQETVRVAGDELMVIVYILFWPLVIIFRGLS